MQRKKNVWSYHPLISIFDFRGNMMLKWYKIFLFLGNLHIHAGTCGLLVINFDFYRQTNLFLWGFIAMIMVQGLNFLLGYMVTGYINDGL